MSEGESGGFDSKPSSAGPFSAPVNTALSSAFGESLADVSVVRGVDSELASIHAAGTTSGKTIGLSSSIKEDLGDPHSMEVIGHEVAHALAGGGSGESLIDEAGDPGESAAHAAGRSFAQFAGDPDRMPSLRPAYGGRATVHRYEIEGSVFGVHDPVHETMTALALQKAGLINDHSAEAHMSDEAWDYTRGAMWNDDPENRLFIGDKTPAVGADWGARFEIGGERAKRGREYKQGDGTIKRSHYGDLQFLHGMALDGEQPEVTQQKMMMWAEFTSKVAAGQIKGDANLRDVMAKNPHFQELIAKDPNLGKMDVNSLFGVKPDAPDRTCDPNDPNAPLTTSIQKRALGSLLHMVQDSYAGGHAEREDLGNGRLGAIKNFHAYGHQDHHKHAESDKVSSEGFDMKQRVLNTRGSQDAILESAVVASMFKEGLPPEAVLAHLQQHTFRFAAGTGPAEAGANYTEGPSRPPSQNVPGPTAADHQRACGHFAETVDMPAETIEGKGPTEVNMKPMTITGKRAKETRKPRETIDMPAETFTDEKPKRRK